MTLVPRMLCGFACSFIRFSKRTDWPTYCSPSGNVNMYITPIPGGTCQDFLGALVRSHSNARALQTPHSHDPKLTRRSPLVPLAAKRSCRWHRACRLNPRPPHTHTHAARPPVHRSSSRSSRRCAPPALLPPPSCPLLTLLSLCVSSKVRDLSHTSASIAPADYASWHDVRTELMAEAKTGFKARVEAELAADAHLPPP